MWSWGGENGWGFYLLFHGWYGLRVSVWVSVVDDAVIAFTPFVVGWMISTAKGAFGWGISAFLAFCAVMWTSTLDTCIWPVAVVFCMPVLLAACTLGNVDFICLRWFDVYDFV